MLKLLLVLVGAAPDGGTAAPVVELPALLRRIAEQLPPANLPCAFTERTTAEELDGKGQATARELHTFRIERSRDGVKRTLVSVEKQLGELGARIRPKPDSELSDEEKERRRRSFRTPFRSEEQPAYRFTWARPPDSDEVAIAFAPVEKDVSRGVGVATVDVVSGRLLTLVSKPSKFPTFLSEMDVRMAFGDTACGWQPTRLQLKGEGGFLFIRTRFRSTTTLDAYTAVP